MGYEEVERLRKKAKRIELIGIFISIIISVVVGVMFKTPIAFFIFVFGFVLTTIINIGPRKKFSLAFKNTYVLKSLQSIFENLDYRPESGLKRDIIANTKMMNMGDRYSSNDYIYGTYKGISVTQADVHIEEEHTTTDSDGHTQTTWVTLFRGRWMVFDFNKIFKANIQVCQKGFGNARISNWGSDLKYKKVQMEDEDFNKRFRIFAQDEHDAFYILTPSLMEKIKRVSESINGRLLFCFVDNKLHIGLQNGKDSFEHGIFKKINEEKVINEISQDIKLITDFVDQLNLDNDLFRKEV